jgi:hypothetical protein
MDRPHWSWHDQITIFYEAQTYENRDTGELLFQPNTMIAKR